jgi:endonuclease/exonuclease/phosphatase family metal-dependent hydrolase
MRPPNVHADLEPWRANVGAPVSLDLAPHVGGPVSAIDVLCWNVAIGKGRLAQVLDSLLRERSSFAPQRPLIALIQEAYRADDSVPEVHTAHHGGKPPRTQREDIVDVARSLNLSLRYAPSMRNGPHRSDRGNAILSSVAIDETQLMTLPFVRQRRAAVAVTIAGIGGRLRMATTHLDTHGRHRPHPLDQIRATRRGFGAGRAAQAAALADELRSVTSEDAGILIGGDFNSYLGLRDPAVRSLIEHGFRHGTRTGEWRHTFHGPLRLMLDHVLYRPSTTLSDVHVRRLDDGTDRARGIFGSDHHPLLASVSLNALAVQ